MINFQLVWQIVEERRKYFDHTRHKNFKHFDNDADDLVDADESGGNDNDFF